MSAVTSRPGPTPEPNPVSATWALNPIQASHGSLWNGHGPESSGAHGDHAVSISLHREHITRESLETEGGIKPLDGSMPQRPSPFLCLSFLSWCLYATTPREVRV